MKKLMALLLAALMMISLVACSGNNVDTTGSTPTESTEPDTTPGSETTNPDNENTVPDTGDWTIKSVAQPELPAPTEVKDTVTVTAQNTTVHLMKAPWSDMNPDTVEAELKKMSLFDGWKWSRTESENAYAQVYTDIGQHNYYEYTLSIVAENDNSRITVSFNKDTNEYAGWRGVSANYSVFGSNISAKEQQAFMPVLELLYGNSAEYLSYAPLTDERYGEMSVKYEHNIGNYVLSRRMDDNSAYFSAYAHTKLENTWKAYAGDYQPMVKDTPEYYTEVFKTGTLNVNDVRSCGAFCKQWLDNYDLMNPSTYDKWYTYKVTTEDSGKKTVDFDLTALVYQKDAAFIEGMEFELGYEVDVENDTVTRVRASFKSPAACSPERDADTNSSTTINALSEQLEHAKLMANTVFGTNCDFSEVYWKGSQDNKLSHSEKITILGIEKTAKFDFTVKSINSIGAYRTTFEISIY